ncbi:hypothetical protein [Pseudomonas farsensis]|uniref:hypothetical protein n=1 Tax=Pseudomonas farsensis TaxID=2745492 RepID=UPI003C7C23B0
MYQTYPSPAQKAHERLSQQIDFFLERGGHIQHVAIGASGTPDGVTTVKCKKERTAKP